MMEVPDAINLLKAYGLYDKAKGECKPKKIDKAPYEMKGHHEVYCYFLSNKWSEFREEREKLLKNKCSELGNMPERLKPIHNDCSFGVYSDTKEYCAKNVNIIKIKFYHSLEKLTSLTKL